MKEDIVLLEKERWAGHILPMPSYTATEHYALSLRRTEDGFCAEFALRPLSSPLVFTPERYDHPDRLYAPHFEGAAAYGILHGEELIAVIELCPEEWNGRMRVTELWVKEDCRSRGLGKRLLTFAKEEARRTGRRALVLETQSCNTRAIAFYFREGLSFIGFDACSYTNEDISRGEVRLELGIIF